MVLRLEGNGYDKEGKDVYVYFDNDQEAYAAFNALSLLELMKK